jgi:surface antigen
VPQPPRALDRSSTMQITPPYAGARAGLDESDEIAALEAIRIALTEVGDGSTYVWRRQYGRLSGIVQPTISFKNASGRVCRHILLIMTVGTATGRAEGIACRLPDGRWQLEG